MKKSLMLLSLLLALSVVCVIGSTAAIHERRDSIQITQKTLLGDPAEVAALEVTTTVLNGRHLRWKSVCGAGADETAKTMFLFSEKGFSQEYAGRAYGFSLDMASLNFSMGGDIELEQEEYNDTVRDMAILPALDVAKRTSSGKTRTELCRLRDYYEYFPLSVNYDMETLHWYNPDQAQIQQFIREAFPIPFPDDLQMQVTVSRDETGAVSGVECNQVNNQETYWECYSVSVCTDRGVFFVLCGNADFSQLPDGYGIYWLPLEHEGERVFLDVNRMENCFPLETAYSDRLKLLESQDGKHLYLLTQEGEHRYLTVLDIVDCTMQQRIDLGAWDTTRSVWQSDTALILLEGNELSEQCWMQVFSTGQEQLELWMETSLYPLSDEESWYLTPTVLFDGERLVLGCFQGWWDTASYRIQLYDAAGIRYVGDYTHSADSLSGQLRPLEVDGMQLRWQSCT